MKITDKTFFNQNAVDLAKSLLGKTLCRQMGDKIMRAKIVEVEAYLGENDSASHVYKGKTERTKIFWEQGGTIYIYLCYGLHYMLNIICGDDLPQAVLIRGVENVLGPGRVTKYFNIDKSFNGKTVYDSDLWIEDAPKIKNFIKTKRIGIEYAKPKDKDALLRFVLKK